MQISIDLLRIPQFIPIYIENHKKYDDAFIKSLRILSFMYNSNMNISSIWIRICIDQHRFSVNEII